MFEGTRHSPLGLGNGPRAESRETSVKRAGVLVLLALALSACTTATTAVATQPPTGSEPAAATAGTNPASAPTVAPATAAPTDAPMAGSKVGITQTLFQPWNSGFGAINYNIVIEVQNTGGQPANIHSGDQSFTVLATDGTVLSTGSFTYSFPEIVGPGEFGYYIAQGAFDDGTKMADVSKLQPSLSSSDSDKPAPANWEFSSIKVSAADYTGGAQVSGMVKNTDAADANLGMVGVILFDAEGKILGAVYDNVGLMQLRAGQSKGFKTSYPSTPKFNPKAVASYKTFGFDFSFF
jgi:hypothetical protein